MIVIDNDKRAQPSCPRHSRSSQASAALGERKCTSFKWEYSGRANNWGYSRRRRL